MSGATSLVRNTCWLLRASCLLCPCFSFCFFSFAFLLLLSPPPRRSMPMLPTLLECRSSGWGSSVAPSPPAFASASTSVRKRSSQTRPEEPDLLNVVADLCNPAMGACLSTSSRREGPAYLQVWRTKGGDELDWCASAGFSCSLPASAGRLCVIYVKRTETAISVQTAEQSTTGAMERCLGLCVFQ